MLNTCNTIGYDLPTHAPTFSNERVEILTKLLVTHRFWNVLDIGKIMLYLVRFISIGCDKWLYCLLLRFNTKLDI
jgi:hypothetical protein